MTQEILVLFDFDGTIVKRGYTYECFEKFNNSKILRKISNSIVKSYTKGKLPSIMEHLVYIILLYCIKGVKSDEIEKYLPKVTQVYLTPNILKAVEELKNRGIKIGIVSENIQFQIKYAARLLGADIVCSNEVEVKDGKITGKIAKFARKNRMIKEIAEQLSLSYDKIIYVGDDADPYGLVKCVLYDPKRKSEEKKVDNKKCFLIKDFSQLLSLIEELYKN